MTFGDPVDITMFAQRKFVNSVLPCVNRQNFKEKWMKHTQLSARVWTGVVIDYLTVVLLASVYDWALPNWTLGWKMVTLVSVCADAVLLLSLGFPLVAKHKLCPLSLRKIDETTERVCRCDIFVFEFAAFKTLSLLHAMFIVAQTLVNPPENLTYHRNNLRLAISVMAVIDIALNSVEMFASGCFWCVCCIQRYVILVKYPPICGIHSFYSLVYNVQLLGHLNINSGSSSDLLERNFFFFLKTPEEPYLR